MSLVPERLRKVIQATPLSEGEKNNRRGVWGTRLGFYFAAIGSAFGLGNIWRFPYVVADNGGGAFVLLYLFFLFLLGLPLLIAELMLGKTTRRSIVMAMTRLKRPHLVDWSWLMPYVGKISVLVALIVLAYFSVISGWVLYFFIHIWHSLVSGHSFLPDQVLFELMHSGWLQVLLTFFHLFIVSLVVANDIEKGIERWVGFMMPVFGILLVVLIGRTLNLSTSEEALRFLFYPDFSQLNYSSFAQAIGHVFFTLSIGFGSMVTFGSYLREKAVIPRAGFRVTAIDSIISLAAGLLIFPIFLASGIKGSGPELLFRTVPVLFREMSGGLWFGVGFFLCLYLAALGASIGLMETAVSNLSDSQKLKRGLGAWWAGFICLFFAIIPALSTNFLQNIRLGRMNLLEICDSLLINWILPLVALMVSQGILYGVSATTREIEFFDEKSAESEKVKQRLYNHWIFVLRWVAPTLIIGALGLQVIGFFQAWAKN